MIFSRALEFHSIRPIHWMTRQFWAILNIMPDVISEAYSRALTWLFSFIERHGGKNLSPLGDNPLKNAFWTFPSLYNAKLYTLTFRQEKNILDLSLKVLWSCIMRGEGTGFYAAVNIPICATFVHYHNNITSSKSCLLLHCAWRGYFGD